MTQEKSPFVFTSEYQKANIEFTKVMENPKIGLNGKLKKLENLADQMGTNLQNIKHFNENILERWVKGKNPELYKAYQATLEEKEVA